MIIQPTDIFKRGLGELMTAGFLCVECKGPACSVQREWCKHDYALYEPRECMREWVDGHGMVTACGF